MIWSDRGGEYESHFAKICMECDIINQITAPYRPQSNGLAEWKKRKLTEMMNGLMIDSDSPRNLWGESIITVNKILNRVPHLKPQSIPYELWTGRKPNLKYFKVWGFLAKVEVPLPKRVKIGPNTVNYVFIGYTVNSKTCWFWFWNVIILRFMLIQ